MAIVAYNLYTLRGDEVRPGIRFHQGGILSIDAQWGYTPTPRAIAVLSERGAQDDRAAHHIYRAHVVQTSVGVPVFFESTGGAEAHEEKDVVLVQEFYTGNGAKRWPGFHVKWDDFDNLTVLSRDGTRKGSGGETWRLVLAPRGWAEYIAYRFDNRRDVPSQNIGVPS